MQRRLARKSLQAVISQRCSYTFQVMSSASSVVDVVAKMKIAWNHRLAVMQIRLQDFHRSANIPALLGGAVPQLEILYRELSW